MYSAKTMGHFGAIIILCSTLCIALIIILLQLICNLRQPHCELVVVLPQSTGDRLKPARSYDKSLLIRMSAYIEYFNETHPSLAQTWPHFRSPQALIANATHWTPARPQSTLVFSNNTLVTPAPSTSPAPTIHSENQNHTSPIPSLPPEVPLDRRDTSPDPNLARSSRNNSELVARAAVAKFQQLDIHEIEMKKLDVSRFEYTLDMRCSSLSLVFVRNSDTIYVSEARLQLNPSSRQKSSCSLSLPKSGMLYPVKVIDGLGHLLCNRKTVLHCYALDNNGRPEGEPLVALNILSLEYETQPAGTITARRSRDFQSLRRKC